MSGFARHGITPKMRPIAPRRPTIVAALDIGSQKIACLIARLKPRESGDVLRHRTHQVEILGFGHVRARGIKSGTVVNIASAEAAIRHAIDAAERMAGLQIESVIVPVTSGRIASERFSAAVQVSGAQVGDADIGRVLAAACNHSLSPGRVVLHSLPTGYSLDDAPDVADPRGLIGQNLKLDMHVATTNATAARNLMLAVERCHVAVEAMVAAPYASGLAVLTDDEPDLGVNVIDIGAGTSTLAVFQHGHFVHADAIALGGQHVTNDLAQGLSTNLVDAERIKTLHGNLILGSSDERDMIAVPRIGDDPREPPANVPRATVTRMIKPRVEEILEMLRERAQLAGFGFHAGSRIVLTGGSSQLPGLADLAATMLGGRVRIGRPVGVSGLPDAARGPAFACVAGLSIYPQFAGCEHFEPRRTRHAMTGTDTYLTRIGRWLRDSF
jgi:cell division protein FtsA